MLNSKRKSRVTYQGKLSEIYRNMCNRVKYKFIKSEGTYELMCRDEFMSIYKYSKVYSELFDNWVKSGYDRNLAPSIDRLDDYKGYTSENIRMVTWKENLDKSHKDRKEGRNNKQSKAIIHINKEGIKNKYYSTMYASRVTGIPCKKIQDVLAGRRKSYKGLWMFE